MPRSLLRVGAPPPFHQKFLNKIKEIWLIGAIEAIPNGILNE